MKEPRDESILSARLARAYASLSPYSAARLAEDLCRIERAQRKHAERCCNGADGGYVKRRPTTSLMRAHGVSTVDQSALWQHDPEAEERAGKRIDRRISAWIDRLVEWQTDEANPLPSVPRIELHGDPRGAVLLIRLPGEAEAKAV